LCGVKIFGYRCFGFGCPTRLAGYCDLGSVYVVFFHWCVFRFGFAVGVAVEVAAVGYCAVPIFL
jgi:hypothetical protein